MHVTLGIYPNKEYKFNVVADEHLENHTDFNIKFRPGRIFYVDGKRVNDGLLKPGYLDEYDKIAKDFFDNFDISKYNKPTIPYR